MSDLISRESLLTLIASKLSDNKVTHRIRAVNRLIKSMPAVDAVEVVHGHWNCNVLFYGTHTCSNCGKDPIHYDGRTGYVEILSDYCPNCGAFMDEVSE